MNISGVTIETSQKFRDARGWFVEIARVGDLSLEVEQVGHSRTRARVLRGLHYHRRQIDLWYLITGRVQIALVDLRDPPRPLKFIAEIESGCRILIPPGVAHGYLALEESDVLYLTSQSYDPSDEFGIKWNDRSLDLAWKIDQPILSERDSSNPSLVWEDIPRF